jgi:predicted CoA-binding protein
LDDNKKIRRIPSLPASCEVPAFSSSSEDVLKVLQSARTIAVVGLSPKPDRDSNKVASYLLQNGYEVVPVNPGQREILGRPCYRSLKDIPFAVDVADLFLNPSRVPAVVEEALEKGIKVIWMQLGVINNEAAKTAMDAGATVIMNRCIMAEHRLLADRIPRQPSQRA